jgi:hypothetical protein
VAKIRTCCDWETFEDAFLAAWQDARVAPATCLIDWKLARRHWNRYGMTGFEAAWTQRKALSDDAMYLRGFWPGGQDGGGDGPGSTPPKTPSPLPALA